MPEPFDDLGRVTTPTLTTQLLKGHGLGNVSIRGVAPVNPRAARFAGPAYTVRYLPVREDRVDMLRLEHPDNLVRRVVEEAPPGAVVVIDAGGRADVGLLGDILAERLRVRGVAGVVADGGMRDVVELGGIDLPVFCAATAAPPSFAALMPADVQRPVCCGGVAVFPGDAVVADPDGVVVVPAALAAQVARDGREQDRLEAYIRRRVARGAAIPGLYPPDEAVRDAYRRWVEAGEPEDPS